MRAELSDGRIKFFIGDVRDRASVDTAMNGVDLVFHAAALKQVPSCDFFPVEAVKTNILGSENVIKSAIAHGAESVVCLSTDKAVFPINAMGMSKAMMEKVAQAAARELGDGAPTRISCVRYGNVMYSRGSVIPLFVRQIRDGRPITVTERDDDALPDAADGFGGARRVRPVARRAGRPVREEAAGRDDRRPRDGAEGHVRRARPRGAGDRPAARREALRDAGQRPGAQPGGGPGRLLAHPDGCARPQLRHLLHRGRAARRGSPGLHLPQHAAAERRRRSRRC